MMMTTRTSAEIMCLRVSINIFTLFACACVYFLSTHLGMCSSWKCDLGIDLLRMRRRYQAAGTGDRDVEKEENTHTRLISITPSSKLISANTCQFSDTVSPRLLSTMNDVDISNNLRV